MEDWQKDHIQKNLPKLLDVTRCNSLLLSTLQAQDILTGEEVKELARTKLGQHASYRLYELLQTRREELKRALTDSHQTIAAKILIEREKNGMTIFNRLDVPLGYDQAVLEIKKQILDNKTPMGVICARWPQFETTGIAGNNIPSKSPYYVPRRLSNRLKLNMEIFRPQCEDVFVFKNIPRSQLSEIARPHCTASSETQLENLSSRFIYLDREEHWNEIVKIATVPVHLIKCEVGQNKRSGEIQFFLENTYGHSEVLQKFGISNQVYMTEDEFVKQVVESDKRVVCICDTPGTGKTYFLENIARILVANYPNKIVDFISLQNFFEIFGNLEPRIDQTTEHFISSMFRSISPTNEAANLLQTLVRNQVLSMELLLDGLDEIQDEQANWIIKSMEIALANLPTVRIFITSSRTMENALERTLGAEAFDLMPFNLNDQIDFLTSFWLNENPNLEPENIDSFVVGCLDLLKIDMRERERDVAGVPLTLQMLAEVYAEEAYTFCRSGEHGFPITPINMCGLYKGFIDLKFDAARNEMDADQIKKIHWQHAYKLLFPEGENLFEIAASDDVIKAILNVGIMQPAVEGQIRFVHRTFAEYLVAEYFADVVSSTRNGNPVNREDIKSFLQEFNINKPSVVFFLEELFLGSYKCGELLCSEKSSKLMTTFKPKSMHENNATVGFKSSEMVEDKQAQQVYDVDSEKKHPFYYTRQDKEASIPCLDQPIGRRTNGLRQSSKWVRERYFGIVGFVYATTSLVMVAGVCIYFAKFSQQISTSSVPDNIPNPTNQNQVDNDCSFDQYNQTYRHVVTEQTMKNYTLKTLAHTAEASSSFLWFEELGSLQIHGNVSSKLVIDILGRTRCLRNLSFENTDVNFRNPSELHKSNFRTENCINVLPNLESLQFDKRITDIHIWIAFEGCQMQHLKEISFINMMFNDKVFRVLSLLQARSPNLRYLKLHGNFEKINSRSPLSIELPTVREVNYEITKFKNTSSSSEDPLVFVNNFCKAFSSLEVFTTTNGLLFQYGT